MRDVGNVYQDIGSNTKETYTSPHTSTCDRMYRLTGCKFVSLMLKRLKQVKYKFRDFCFFASWPGKAGLPRELRAKIRSERR